MFSDDDLIDAASAVPALKIRPSQVNRYLACPARYELERHAGFGDTLTVSQVFGNAVHADVAGEGYALPEIVSFDRWTRNWRDFHAQRKMAVRAFMCELERWNLTVERSELDLEIRAAVGRRDIVMVGRIDLICRDQWDRSWVVDLSTSRRTGRSKGLQVALYTWMLEKYEELSLSGAYVLRFARGMTSMPEGCEIFRYEYTEMMKEAETVLNTMAALDGVDRAMAIPGEHCVKCENLGCVYNDGE